MKRLARPDLMSNILKSSLAICAVAYLAVYVVLAVKRASYPYELEWMEGGAVDHVIRVLAGKQIYVEPSLDFIPYLYNPFFYYVGAMFSRLFGIGFFSLRLISILASLGCFILLFEFVRRETKSVFSGVLSAGLFAATYRVAGAWLDIARPDSLMMLLMLWSIFLIRFHDDAKHLVLAALLMFLSFFTKQTALIVAIALGIHCLISLPKWKKLVYPVTFALALGTSTFVLGLQSKGWYYYYVYHLTRQLSLLKYQIVYFWLHDVNYVSIAFAISLAYCISLLLSPRRKGWSFHFLLLGGMIGTSYLLRLYSGTYDNTLLPACAAIAIFFGLGTHELTSPGTAGEPMDTQACPSSRARLQAYSVLLACVLQFVLLAYNPFAQLPSQRDLSAGRALIRMLESKKGEVFLPFHGYLPSLAGKRTYAHAAEIDLIMHLNDHEQKSKLWNEILSAVHSKRFEAIVMDEDCWGLEIEIRKEYPAGGKVFNEPGVFWPVTGMRTRPELIYEWSR